MNIRIAALVGGLTAVAGCSMDSNSNQATTAQPVQISSTTPPALPSGQSPQALLAPIVGQMCVGDIGQMTRIFVMPVVTPGGILVHQWGNIVTGATVNAREPFGFPRNGYAVPESRGDELTFTLDGKGPGQGRGQSKKIFTTRVVQTPDGYSLVGSVEYADGTMYDGKFKMNLPCHVSTTEPPPVPATLL